MPRALRDCRRVIHLCVFGSPVAGGGAIGTVKGTRPRRVKISYGRAIEPSPIWRRQLGAWRQTRADAGVIVSASYRTDIPAFYSGWLLRRLEAGFCRVANPY